MKELLAFAGMLIALGCLCAGIWHGVMGEYPAALPRGAGVVVAPMVALPVASGSYFAAGRL